MSLKERAALNLKTSILANGGNAMDVRLVGEERARKLSAIRKDRAGMFEFLNSGRMPWSRAEWRWNDRAVRMAKKRAA